MEIESVTAREAVPQTRITVTGIGEVLDWNSKNSAGMATG